MCTFLECGVVCLPFVCLFVFFRFRQLKTFLFAQYWRWHPSALETLVSVRSINLLFTFTLYYITLYISFLVCIVCKYACSWNDCLFVWQSRVADNWLDVSKKQSVNDALAAEETIDLDLVYVRNGLNDPFGPAVKNGSHTLKSFRDRDVPMDTFPWRIGFCIIILPQPGNRRTMGIGVRAGYRLGVQPQSRANTLFFGQTPNFSRRSLQRNLKKNLFIKPQNALIRSSEMN